jgi:hypothetical protein
MADHDQQQATSLTETSQPVSRRGLLRRALETAAAATAGAVGASAIAGAVPVRAVNGDPVRVGQTNAGTVTTEVRNTAAVSNAVALRGVVTTPGPGGATAGAWGQSNGQNGTGVFGLTPAGNSRGVWGRSVNGRGVYGEATGTTGRNYGVYGKATGAAGIALYGVADTGVYGQGGRTGTLGAGTEQGVYGYGGKVGVFGSGTDQGVWGYGGPLGVYGTGQTWGVWGEALHAGVKGTGHTGVSGQGNFGVAGSGSEYGVYGFSANGLAGLFQGKAHVNGTFTATTKNFLIDHPADPANRTLAHACVEAPEMLNVYRGTVTLDTKGTASVRLPRYFRSLNIDFGYQLTPIGAPAPALHVAKGITRNSFAIAGGNPGQRVCWIVTGARQDAWAQEHPLRVERTKKPTERGRYLNPELFGKPRSAAIHALPKVSRRLLRREPRPTDAPRRPRVLIEDGAG